MRILNSAYQFNYPIGPVNYIENHDHAPSLAGRQPRLLVQDAAYMIALATCSAASCSTTARSGASLRTSGRMTAMPRRRMPVCRLALWIGLNAPIPQADHGRYLRFLLQIRQNHPGSAPEIFTRTPTTKLDLILSRWLRHQCIHASRHLSPVGKQCQGH